MGQPGRRPDREGRVAIVVVQISDPHLGADWGVGEPAQLLGEAAAAVRALDVRPDAVVVSGDLADHGDPVEYEAVRRLLEPTGAPLFALPGNHDDRDRLREHFDLPDRGEHFAHYAVEVGPLRLVLLDTKLDGEGRGELGRQRLEWLDDTLAAAPEQPTLIAMHHPPVLLGIPAMDEIGLSAPDRQAFDAVIQRHRQVVRIVCGHAHRAAVSTTGQCLTVVAPSTYVQTRLVLGGRELDFVPEPRGFVVHVFDGETMVSHVQKLGSPSSRT